MPKNTSKTYLYRKAAEGEWAKVCDITSYPDVFTPPPRLDATTLSNTQRVYIPDIADVPDMTFGMWYEVTEFEKIKGFEGTPADYQLRFGDTGEDGVFSWTGDIFVTPLGGSVGAVREGQITTYPSTEITFGTSIGA